MVITCKRYDGPESLMLLEFLRGNFLFVREKIFLSVCYEHGNHLGHMAASC